MEVPFHGITHELRVRMLKRLIASILVGEIAGYQYLNNKMEAEAA